MIIVKLIGGLGNQMFQYAAGRALAVRHNVDLKFDLSALRADPEGKYTKRHFALDVFGNLAPEATAEELRYFYQRSESRVLRVLQRQMPSLFKRVYAAESGQGYHRSFARFPADTYLDGFWQSERFFVRFADRVRGDFEFRPEVKALGQHWMKSICSTNSVSLHVRRGDYISNSDVRKYHGVCSPDYYNAAVAELQKRHAPIELFVFSDDIAWCRDHLSFEVPVHLVDVNTAATDMYLMSLCRHHIIANSSFSWWGAWLNANKDKTVIMPEHWFVNVRSKDIDLVPRGWITR